MSFYLSKIAGIFQPPPAMVREIFIWTRSIYCARILYSIEQKLKDLGGLEVVEEIYNEDSDEPNDYELGFVSMPDQTIVELNLVKKECLKYTSIRWAGHKAAKKFPIDFNDWKYIGQGDKPYIKNLGQITVLLSIAPKHQFGGTWESRTNVLSINVQQNIETIEDFNSNLENLYRILYHELQHLGQSTLHLAKPAEIFQSGLPSPKIQNMDRQHSEQSLDIANQMRSVLNNYLLNKTEKERLLKQLDKKFERLQPKELPADEVEPDRILHELRDEEFYTDLQENIDSIKIFLKKIPKKIRLEYLKYFTMPIKQIQVPEEYYQGVIETIPKMGIPDPKFFRNLLIYEPKKWRKAVGLLYKELQKDIELE